MSHTFSDLQFIPSIQSLQSPQSPQSPQSSKSPQSPQSPQSPAHAPRELFPGEHRGRRGGTFLVNSWPPTRVRTYDAY